MRFHPLTNSLTHSLIVHSLFFGKKDTDSSWIHVRAHRQIISGRHLKLFSERCLSIQLFTPFSRSLNCFSIRTWQKMWSFQAMREISTGSILLLVVVVVVFFFQNYSMPFFLTKRIAFKVYWLSWWDTMKIDKRCIVVGRSVTYSSVLNVVKICINNDGNFASLLPVIKILYPLCTHY